MNQPGYKQPLYFADFLYANGLPPKDELPSLIFYADDDEDAKRLASMLSVSEEKEVLMLCKYDTRLMPTIIARFGEIEPVVETLTMAEKRAIGLLRVKNIDTPVRINQHASRVRKAPKKVGVH